MISKIFSKCYLFIALLVLFSASAGQVKAESIDDSTAIKVAKNWFRINNTNKSTSVSDVKELLYEYIGDVKTLYIINYTEGGYVIISADNEAIPILGYSFEGNYDKDNIPPQMKVLLENYEEQIIWLKNDKSKSLNDEINQKWQELTDNNYQPTRNKALKVTAPLLQSKWAQGSGWNKFCPSDANGSGGHVPVGCVAVAMAQIMKYWNYPSSISSIPSYNHLTYGTQGPIGSFTYNWGSMGLTSSDDYNARLLYHCGVSVEMDYGVDASSANNIDAANAFINYFKYKNTVKNASKSAYPTTWASLIMTELDNKKPVCYFGTGSSGGHAFVVDGYDNNSLFHINWGWGGSYDGNFSLDNLNPSTYTFNTGQVAIIGIVPNYPDLTPQTVTITPSAVNSGDYLSSIKFVLKNISSVSFSGSVKATIYLSTDKLITTSDVLLSTETQTIGSLSANASSTYTFTSAPQIPESVTTGSYYVGVIIEATDADNSNNMSASAYVAPITVTQVLTPGSAGTITGITSICQGQSTVTYTVPVVAKATSYVWTLPTGATGSSTTNTITVDYSSTITAGTISVKGKNDYGEGLPSSLALTIKYKPAAAGLITGSTSECQGAKSLQYSTTAINNADSYVWVLPTGFTGSSTALNILVDISKTANTGTITVKGNNGCGYGVESSLSVNINLLPLPPSEITGVTRVCQGESKLYTASKVNGANSYVWTLPNGLYGSSISNTITTNISSTAQSGDIQIRTVNSCGTSELKSFPITVNEHNKPQVNEKWDDILVVNNKDKKFTTYQWYIGSQLIANANGQYYKTNKQAGNYTVLVTDINGCKSTSSNFKALFSTSLFPNPVNLNSTLSVESKTDISQIKFYNSTGNLVKTIEGPGNQFRIAVNNLTKGMYVLEITKADHSIENQKILIIE